MCSGHPRDLGLAQGSAAAVAIRAEVARLGLPRRRSRIPSLTPLASGPIRGAGAGRSLFRHFAHQAERLEGLARAADLPLDSLVELHLRVRAGGDAGGLLSRRAVVRASAAGGGRSQASQEKGVRLERTLPPPAPGEAGWILRESRPAVGFRSAELTLPWLVTSVAGVNEGGLAVVGAPLLWGEPSRSGHPTSLLLVQECLQRFSALAGAVDWCRRRPVGGEQSIVLADATGAVATVTVHGGERRVQTGQGELQLEGGEPVLAGSGESVVDEGGSGGPDGESHFDAAGPSAGRVRLDPRARRLELVGPDEERTISLG